MSKKTIMYFITAILCNITAIMNFIGKSKFLGGLWILIGAINVLAAIIIMKNNEE